MEKWQQYKYLSYENVFIIFGCILLRFECYRDLKNVVVMVPFVQLQTCIIIQEFAIFLDQPRVLSVIPKLLNILKI